MADNRNRWLEECPNPEKVPYSDPRDAAKALRQGGKRTRGNIVYRCVGAPHPHWHLGKNRGHPRTWEARRPRRRIQ